MADEVPPTPDPFAAIGGGVYENGGWKPKGMATGTAAPAAPTTPGAPAAPAPAPAQGGAAPQVQSALTDVLTRTLTGPTPEQYAQGASTGPEAAGFRIAARRGLDRALAQNAESSAYSGLSNAGGRERQLRQQTAESEAGFVGNLAGQRMQDRRNELFQAMNLAASQGDAAAARALQLKLGEMDAALKEKGLNVQSALGGSDIDARLRIAGMDDATRRLLGQGDLDLRKLLGMSGLGIDTAKLQLMAQQDAMNSILGAL